MIPTQRSSTYRDVGSPCWLTGKAQLRIADVVRHFQRRQRPPMVVARCPGCGGWHDVTDSGDWQEEGRLDLWGRPAREVLA